MDDEKKSFLKLPIIYVRQTIFTIPHFYIIIFNHFHSFFLSFLLKIPPTSLIWNILSVGANNWHMGYYYCSVFITEHNVTMEIDERTSKSISRTLFITCKCDENEIWIIVLFVIFSVLSPDPITCPFESIPHNAKKVWQERQMWLPFNFHTISLWLSY